MRYFLSIDYDEGDTKSYRGVLISDYKDGKSVELVRINTGSLQLDEKRAFRKLSELVGNVEVCYLSSYDNYYMDLDYENDPEYRAEVDKGVAEMDEKIEKYKIEIGKGKDDKLTIEEFNYIYNRKDV